MANSRLFLQVKETVEAEPGTVLLLGDLAELTIDNKQQKKVEEIKIMELEEGRQNSLTISAVEVIAAIQDQLSNLQINYLGPKTILVKLKSNLQLSSTSSTPEGNWKLAVIVGVILFLGSGVAIMNFHADVNMKTVHQQIYRLVMGTSSQQPLLLQIPYSLGIACGMLIFFNGLFGLSFDDDPSPLEVENYLYEEQVVSYLQAKKSDQSESES